MREGEAMKMVPVEPTIEMLVAGQEAWVVMTNNKTVIDECEHANAAGQDVVARVESALEIILQFGGIDGAHHKTWVIDQVCRKLLAEKYDAFVANAKDGEDGPDTYAWDEGIAP